MSRSPLAYPLTRGIDGDSGGAADLQTDIMRFMAILALCLVAIFALVQSLPIAPDPPAAPAPAIAHPLPAVKPAEPVRDNGPRAAAAKPPADPPVSLARPARTPVPGPAPSRSAENVSSAAEPPPKTIASTTTSPAGTSAPRPAVEPQGFTLRFESDLALTRLVASGQVGFYAIAAGRAQRMSVHNSRISFWDASTPGEFHEMESSTVPPAVVEALQRSGTDAAPASFGVTLPSRLRAKLAQLMRAHRGGALVISVDGELELEPAG